MTYTPVDFDAIRLPALEAGRSYGEQWEEVQANAESIARSLHIPAGMFVESHASANLEAAREACRMLGELGARAVRAIGEAFTAAFAPMFEAMTRPEFVALLVKLNDARRYARGQGRKKPRGRRKKETSRLAWDAFFAIRRAA